MLVICPINKITLVIFPNTYTQIHVILFAYITLQLSYSSVKARVSITYQDKKWEVMTCWALD